MRATAKPQAPLHPTARAQRPPRQLRRRAPCRESSLRTACAAGAEDVATVTALSNAAGAFSVPESNRDNALPPRLMPDDVGRLVEQLSPFLRPRVPTGNGFCMYVTRHALNRVGLFDEAN